MLSWVITAAAITLIGSVAKFIDDHHMRDESKNRIRVVLIRAFVWLEDLRMPNWAQRFTRWIARPVSTASKWRLVRVFFLIWPVLCVMAVTAFYFVRQLFGRPPGNYFGYVTSWIFDLPNTWFWLAYVTWVVLASFYLSLLGVLFLLLRSSEAVFALKRVAYLVLAVLTPFFCAALSGTVAVFEIGPYGVTFLFFVCVLLALPSFTIAAVASILVCLHVFVLTLNRLFKIVFEAASGPASSPLLYFSSLLSVLVLILKLTEVW